MSMAKKNTNSMSAWSMLLLAGAFEIGYAISVGSSQAFTILKWSVIAAIFFLCTLFCLSVALRKIDVGIGYAVWAGIGAVGAAVFGSIFLHQSLSPSQIFWLAIIIIGVVWLKLSDSVQFQEKISHTTNQNSEQK